MPLPTQSGWPLASCLGFALLSATAFAQQVSEPLEFELVEVRDAAGISFVHQYTRGKGESIVESAGSGAAWVDYDVDGDVDVILVNGLPRWGGDAAAGNGHALFRNNGGRFRQAPGHNGVVDRTWGNGIAVADVDNDGFPDVLITAIGPDRLYRNNGDGTFTAVRAGVEDDGWGTSAAFVNWDRDGFVDLYVARYVVPDQPGRATAAGSMAQDEDRVDPLGYVETCFYEGSEIEVYCGPRSHEGLQDLLYRNVGDGTFEPWRPDEVDPGATPGFAVVATDCDNDLSPEIFVANDLAINLLYRRTEDGGLEDWALLGGVGYSGAGYEQAGMSATAGDVDGDGLFDLFVSNYENDYNTLYHNFGNCSFEDATARYGLATSGIPFMGWGALFVDIDGDADEDLFVANGHIFPQLEEAGISPFGQRNLLYANQLRETGLGEFVEVEGNAGDGMLVIASSRSVIRGDYDDDGDADILVTNVNDEPTLLRNDGDAHAPSLRLTLIGRSSNRTAYGARILVRSGGVEQHFEQRGSDGFQGSNDPRLLVHLPGGVADMIDITWSSGSRTVLQGEQAGKIVIDEERGVLARSSW